MKLTAQVVKLCLVVLVSGLLFTSTLAFAGVISAQDSSSSTPSEVDITADELADYRLATADCSTPSLECLVRNVSRFTAIEWVQDIIGKDNKICIEEEGCTDLSSNNSGTNVADTGAIGSLSNLITAMYTHPVADTQTYVAYVLKSAHITAPAYAQGLGFSSLDPVLNLWTTFRNIAYMFFVLIFVVVGFLIMFRQKVGQTAITAQQAIPQIIISLILVTFSYAIAGLLIDLMYVLMALIIGVFSSFFSDDVFGYNIFQLGGKLFEGAADFYRNKDFISGFLTGLDINGAANQVVSLISSLTLMIILTIAMLIGIVRLFFELLKSYATIVISVVVAPLLLMMGAIPGRSNAFGSWIKTLVGHLSPFPVILMVLVMFYAFTEGAVNASSGGFMPPFLLNAGNGIGESIIALMSLAIILALPDIVIKIRDGIAPKDAFGELITNKGWSNFKDGWTGKGLKGFGAKRGLSMVAKTPMGLAGAVGGVGLANKYAKTTGLTGKERTAALIGGGLVGGGLGYNAPKAVRSIGRGAVSQVKDTIIKIQTDKFSTSLLGAMDTEHTEADKGIAQGLSEQQKNVPTSPAGTAPPSPKGTIPISSRRSSLT